MINFSYIFILSLFLHIFHLNFFIGFWFYFSIKPCFHGHFDAYITCLEVWLILIKIFILNMSYVFTPNILLSQLLIFPFAEQRVFFFNYFEYFPVGYISIPIGKHTWQLLVEMIKYASVWVDLFICLYYLFEEFALFNQESIIFIIFFIHNDFFLKRLCLIKANL